MKKTEFIKGYAGAVTAVLVFIVYMVAMWKFTNKDMLEILIGYFVFLMIPAFGVPYLLTEDDDEKSE